MEIIKKNHYVALLIGVIFVSISSISVFWQAISVLVEGSAGVQMIQSAYASPAENRSATVVVDHHLSAGDGIRISGEITSVPQPVYSQNLMGNQSTKSNITSVRRSADASLEVPAYAHIDPISAQEVLSLEVIDYNTPPKQLYFTRTKLLSLEEKENATREYVLSDEELYLLNKIVMAEAEGEPYEGKVAVANVVLNRLRSANFPDTITDVIYQKYQFSPVANGRLDRVEPNEDCIQAVTDALYGKMEVTSDTYYFLSLELATDLTIHKTKEATTTIGNHSFYK